MPIPMPIWLTSASSSNRVVAWLAREVKRNDWFKDKVERTLPVDTTKPQWEEALGNAMFQLNIAAVNARYGDGGARHFRKLEYQYQPEYATKIQVYKSLRCWLYQCTEGDVFKRPLYQAFDSLIADYLMRQIIADLPEYQNAVWG
jgi:hypothetical protein